MGPPQYIPHPSIWIPFNCIHHLLLWNHNLIKNVLNCFKYVKASRKGLAARFQILVLKPGHNYARTFPPGRLMMLRLTNLKLNPGVRWQKRCGYQSFLSLSLSLTYPGRKGLTTSSKCAKCQVKTRNQCAETGCYNIRWWVWSGGLRRFTQFPPLLQWKRMLLPRFSISWWRVCRLRTANNYTQLSWCTWIWKRVNLTIWGRDWCGVWNQWFRLSEAINSLFHRPAVRQWTDVSCVKHPELQVVLLEGKEKEETPTQSILPLPSHRSLSHKR